MMRLFRRFNPFRYFGYDYTHPLLHYAVREIRGGRTPAGLNRYMRKVLIVVGLLVLAGLPVTLMLSWQGARFTASWYYNAALMYMLGAIAISGTLFVIVDAVTIFFAAMSIRTELGQPVKFDLLRVSPLQPGSYVASRLVLAQVRSWRVFVVMWAARLCVWVLLVALSAFGLLIAVYENGYLGLPDITDLLVVLALVVAFLIFSAMFLLEPIWRFRMLAEIAVSVAARFRQGVWMWFALGGAVAAVLFVQGIIAILVVSGGQILYLVVYRLLVWLPSEVRSVVASTVGFIPWLLMPFIVWAYQNRVARWRRRVTERFIFARHEKID